MTPAVAARAPDEIALPFRPTLAEAALLAAARRRGIAVAPLGWRRALVLSRGGRQAWLDGTVCHRTSALAQRLAGEKAATRRRLAALGLPVCAGALAHDRAAALAIADRLGGAVAVKPNCGAQGVGVRTGLRDRSAIARAYDHAAGAAGVLIEAHHPGRDLRVLVVAGKAVAAAERHPAAVTGDGVRTVVMLIDEFNADRRRSGGHLTALSAIGHADEDFAELLAAQDLALGSVPAAGVRIRLCWGANLSRGGFASDCSDILHPALAALAVDAARAIGLDIAGVDLMADDIAAGTDDAGARILEVNASPGIRMHLAPSLGRSRDVAGSIIDYLFDPGHDPAAMP